MTTRVLAGDVGGTKTNLALYCTQASGEACLEREGSLPSQDFARLEDLVGRFLAEGGERPAAAAFGIAGPVLGGEVRLTNLPWRIETGRLSQTLEIPHLRLLNDLETTAYGALFLPPEKRLSLNEGVVRPGNKAVIAAGTGLGQAMLFWDGERYRPSATEGGHASFAPRNEREMALLRFLLKRYERVSWERIVSGPGLFRIFEYLDQEEGLEVEPRVRERIRSEDPSAVVGSSGVEGSCAACREAVELFVSLYGAQAANLALTVMSLGGVYVGGGVVTKLLPVVQAGGFVQAFRDVGRFGELLTDMPVEVLLDPKASLLGAAEVALDLLSERQAG